MVTSILPYVHNTMTTISMKKILLNDYSSYSEAYTSVLLVKDVENFKRHVYRLLTFINCLLHFCSIKSEHDIVSLNNTFKYFKYFVRVFQNVIIMQTYFKFL